MRNKLKAIAVFLILLCAATAQAKGWRGIVPLHSTRSQVEQLLGPPTELSNPYSVVYKTPNETIEIDYADGSPCGVGEKYSRWRVPRNTVTSIIISPYPGSPLSQLNIDESRYRKLIVGHLSETRYVNSSEGEAWTMGFDSAVRSISYFPATDDSHLECPGWTKTNNINCEYISDPFASAGDVSFELDKFVLDNFFMALSKKSAIAYIIAYGGKRARGGEAMKRANRAKQYLIAVRRVPADRIKLINGGYREKRDLELYVVSEGVCPPTPSPTVDPRDVEIVSRGRRK